MSLRRIAVRRRGQAAAPTRTGRPPAGLREGEMVKDYPQLSVRVPPEVRATVSALSTMRSQPQWRIITDALECYLREHSDQDRRLLDDLVRRATPVNGHRRNGDPR